MEFNTVVGMRRSVRSYQDRPVPEQAIADMKRAATLAPTGMNEQDFQLYFVTNRELIEKIGTECAHQEHIGQAALLVVASCPADKTFNAALVMQNVALTATNHGLGSCFVGWLEREPLRKMLEIDSGLDIPILLTVGYADEVPEFRNRKAPEELFIDVE